MSSEPYADVREMYMAHAMFRREFGMLPALISGVRAGDAARAEVVAQHSEGVSGYVLYRVGSAGLIERFAAEVAPAVREAVAAERAR